MLQPCRSLRSLLALLALVAVFGLAGCSRKRDEAYFLATGKQFLAKKDYGRALLQFRNASALKPTDADPYYQAGLVSLATRDYRAALLAFKKATELDPKNADAQLQLAQLLLAANDQAVLADAEVRARTAVASTPASGAALNILALTELKLGHTPDAQKYLEEAFTKSPASLKVAANLASVKLSKQDFKGAEDVLKKTVAEAPQSPKPLVALGRLYLMTKNFPEAERQFQRATEVDPKYAVALMDLAEVQKLERAFDRAEQTYRRVAALPDPEYKHAYAAFLMEQHRSEEAIGELRRLFQRDRHDLAARSRLVAAYLGSGKLPDALAVLDAALQENRKDRGALLQRAEIRIIGRDFQRAQQDLHTVLQLNPDAAEAHYLLAAAYDGLGAQFSRRDELAKALQLRPGLLAARVELAQCHIVAGNYSYALELIRQAPPAQQQTLEAIEQRNWALAGLKNWGELRKGIDQGLAQQRTPDLLLQDSLLRMQQKDYAGARATLEETLKSVKDIRLLKALAGTYMAQKQPALALHAVEEQAAQAPKSAAFEYFLGQWLLANGSPQQAKSAFLATKTADPNFAEADLGLSQIDFASGNADAARQRLAALVARRENASARLLLGAIEESANHPDAAVEQYRKALQAQPENFMALNNLAFLLADAGQSDEALALAKKAFDLAGAEPAVEDTLGWALYRKGMFREAAQHFQTAFSKQPAPRVQYHLAMAYVKTGDYERGLSAYLAALQKNAKLPEARLAGEVVRQAPH